MSGIKFETVGRALEWLEGLEPAEIMEVLEDYPGRSNTQTQCVLARFCKEVTGKDVLVGLNRVTEVFQTGIPKNHSLGPKLHSFRVKFDDGDYPWLEQP